MISWNGCVQNSTPRQFQVVFSKCLTHFRIGMGVNTEMFAEGLDRISRALANR